MGEELIAVLLVVPERSNDTLWGKGGDEGAKAIPGRALVDQRSTRE
jgi:predicted NAD-dependent protein-ADP-ribosyltransferase YbiA (DUF1768 family)